MRLCPLQLCYLDKQSCLDLANDRVMPIRSLLRTLHLVSALRLSQLQNTQKRRPSFGILHRTDFEVKEVTCKLGSDVNEHNIGI